MIGVLVLALSNVVVWLALVALATAYGDAWAPAWCLAGYSLGWASAYAAFTLGSAR